MTAPRCFVVGIGGCSNGGKTTLSHAIREEYISSVVLHMDEFYRDDDDPEIEMLDIYGGKFANWDSMKSFNSPKFLKEFQTHLKKSEDSNLSSILIVEGIFIFSFSLAYIARELQPYLSRKYFLDLPFDEGLRRRRLRKYERSEPDDYFERVAWPAYGFIKEQCKKQSDIIYLDGKLNICTIIQTVLDDIKKALHSNHVALDAAIEDRSQEN